MKKIVNFGGFALIVLVSCFNVYSQESGSIEGRVTGGDSDVGKVTVSAESGSARYETALDANREFSFEGLKPGVYKVVAELLVEGDDGIKTQQSLEVRLQSGEKRRVELSIPVLIRNRNQFEVMVNIAENADQPLDTVSKSVNVILGQEMRERADFSLVESLRTIPGFRVQQLGGFGRTASIKTRGLRNQDTAILIDGFRFRDSSSIAGDASAFLSDITLTSVSRVEVLRGAGSSLYGTNAIGGAVDFRTPAPRKGFHGQLSGAFGQLGLTRVRGNTSYGTEGESRFGYNLGVARTVYSKGIDGDDASHNTTVGGRIDWKITEKSLLSSRLFVSDSFVKLNSNPDTLGVLPTISTVVNASQGVNFVADVDDPDAEQRGTAVLAQFDFDSALSDSVSLNAAYQAARTQRSNINGVLGSGYQPFGGNELSKFAGDVDTARAAIKWFGRRGFSTFGYEFEHEKYHNDGSSASANSEFFTDGSQSSNTFFINGTLKALDGDFNVSGSGRFSLFSVSNPEFSTINPPYSNLDIDNPPSAFVLDGSAMYRIRRSNTRFRAHIGNGYRVPSLYERLGTFYSSFSQSFTAIGDPYLKPEKSIGGDAGIDQGIGRHFEASATYFYNSLIDTIGYGFGVAAIGTTARPWGGYLNEKGGISRGAEVSIRSIGLKSTQIFASYTYTNSDQRTAQVAGSGVIESLGIPKNQFTAVFTQRFKGLALNLDLLISDSYLAPIYSNTFFESRIYRFNGNRRADFTARYDFKYGRFLADNDLKFVVFATIENLLNNEYFENGFKTAGRNSRFGLGVSF